MDGQSVEQNGAPHDPPDVALVTHAQRRQLFAHARAGWVPTDLAIVLPRLLRVSSRTDLPLRRYSGMRRVCTAVGKSHLVEFHRFCSTRRSWAEALPGVPFAWLASALRRCRPD